MAMILALQGGGGAGMALVIQLVVVVGIIYFLFILPQKREQKKHREMLAMLKPGNEVVTAGGLVGEIIQIRENLVTLKSGESRVIVELARISRLAGGEVEAK